MESNSDALPLDIILHVLSYLQLIDLCRLLNANDDLVSDYCRYVLQSRAKTQAWELVLLTPEGYAAAQCNGDLGYQAIARFRCVAHDTRTEYLRFVPCEDHPCTLTLWDEMPTSLTVVCTQWIQPLGGVQVVPVTLWRRDGRHTLEDSAAGIQIAYRSCESHSICQLCHRHQRSVLQVYFENIFVSFEWLRQGLLA